MYRIARWFYYKTQNYPLVGSFVRILLKLRRARFERRFSKVNELESFIERRIDELFLTQNEDTYKKRDFKWPPDGK